MAKWLQISSVVGWYGSNAAAEPCPLYSPCPASASPSHFVTQFAYGAGMTHTVKNPDFGVPYPADGDSISTIRFSPTGGTFIASGSWDGKARQRRLGYVASCVICGGGRVGGTPSLGCAPVTVLLLGNVRALGRFVFGSCSGDQPAHA